MTRHLIITLVLATSAAAHADCPQDIQPDGAVAACRFKSLHEIGAEGSLEQDPQDQGMVAVRPVSPRNPPRLVVIFHGHPGPATTGFTKFQHLAAELGMYSITLDYDFSGNNGEDFCAANLGSSSTCSNAPHAICGCYSSCYGALHNLVWKGQSHPGLPDPVAGLEQGPFHYNSVEFRLRSYLQWLAAQPSGSGWSQFLSGGNIAYDNIILAGLSRGTTIAGFIAKHEHTDRVLLFSGPGDERVTGGGFGTSGVPTTYRWGVENGVGTCTEQPAAAAWIADNDFFGNTGTPWATRRLISLDDQNDDHFVVQKGIMVFGTFLDDGVLGMTQRHDPGFPDGFFGVGSAASPDFGFETSHHKMLLANPICATTADHGHVETLGNGGTCTAQENTFRRRIWTYMLTVQQ